MRADKRVNYLLCKRQLGAILQSKFLWEMETGVGEMWCKFFEFHTIYSPTLFWYEKNQSMTHFLQIAKNLRRINFYYYLYPFFFKEIHFFIHIYIYIYCSYSLLETQPALRQGLVSNRSPSLLCTTCTSVIATSSQRLSSFLTYGLQSLATA